MSIYHKDKGGIQKIGGYLTQRFNTKYFNCARSIENGQEYYTVPSAEVMDYFKTFEDNTLYAFGFTEANTTTTPKLRLNDRVLNIEDFLTETDGVQVGQLLGVFQMFTQDLASETIYFVSTTHPDQGIVNVSAHELPYGSDPTVENKGTAPKANLDFGIPAGKPGSKMVIVDHTTLTLQTTEAQSFVGKVRKWACTSFSGVEGDFFTYRNEDPDDKSAGFWFVQAVAQDGKVFDTDGVYGRAQQYVSGTMGSDGTSIIDVEIVPHEVNEQGNMVYVLEVTLSDRDEPVVAGDIIVEGGTRIYLSSWYTAEYHEMPNYIAKDSVDVSQGLPRKGDFIMTKSGWTYKIDTIDDETNYYVTWAYNATGADGANGLDALEISGDVTIPGKAEGFSLQAQDGYYLNHTSSTGLSASNTEVARWGLSFNGDEALFVSNATNDRYLKFITANLGYRAYTATQSGTIYPTVWMQAGTIFVQARVLSDITAGKRILIVAQHEGKYYALNASAASGSINSLGDGNNAIDITEHYGSSNFSGCEEYSWLIGGAGGDARIEVPISKFNRTPVVGDTFFAMFTEDEVDWLGNFRVSTISGSYAVIEQVSAKRLTGPEGKQGAQGNPGTNGQRGLGLYRVSQSLTTSSTSATVANIATLPVDKFQVGDMIIDSNALVFAVTAETALSATTVPVSYRLSFKGAKGDTGAMALECNIEVGTGTSLSMTTSNFNRTPVVGDAFMATYYSSDVCYMGLYTVTAVSGTTVTCTRQSTRKITGPQGNPGGQGDPGADGKGIKSVSVNYAQQSSATTTPTSWTASPPTSFTAGYYVWCRIITTYTDDTTDTVYMKSRNGSNGSPGSSGSNAPNFNALLYSSSFWTIQSTPSGNNGTALASTIGYGPFTCIEYKNTLTGSVNNSYYYVFRSAASFSVGSAQYLRYSVGAVVDATTTATSATPLISSFEVRFYNSSTGNYTDWKTTATGRGGYSYNMYLCQNSRNEYFATGNWYMEVRIRVSYATACRLFLLNPVVVMSDDTTTISIDEGIPVMSVPTLETTGTDEKANSKFELINDPITHLRGDDDE